MARGVYKIENKITGKCYIGSSVNIEKRWKTHLFCLNGDRHQNQKLQNSWNKHGKDQFLFIIIEVVEDVSILLQREQRWIDLLNCVENGYNLAIVAGSPLGMKRSQEVREKLSLAKLGKKNSKEHCRNISLSKMGNIYAAGRVMSEKHKAKLSQLMQGNQRGKGVVFTQERRQKMALAKTGNTHAQGNTNMLGKTHSQEARNKMSASQDARRLRESKLSEDQALLILKYPKKHGYVAELVRMLGVSRDIVQCVLDGKTFKYLQGVE